MRDCSKDAKTYIVPETAAYIFRGKKCVGGCSFIKESVCTREAEKCETSYLAMLACLRLASNTEYGIQGANPPQLFPCNA